MSCTLNNQFDGSFCLALLFFWLRDQRYRCALNPIPYVRQEHRKMRIAESLL